MSSVSRRARSPGWANESFGRIHPVTAPLSDPAVPLLYEDDGFEDMGDTDIHTRTINNLAFGYEYHFEHHGVGDRFAVFRNLNLHYAATDHKAYLSPDIMIVSPAPAEKELTSYRIGEQGPAPLHVVEVLSQRTFQQRDLSDKPLMYAKMKVAEYALVDATGEFLAVRLLLKRLQGNGAWKDIRDSDGGFTSQLGFRVVLDSDGHVRVLDARTGKAYLRPSEAQAALDAEERARRAAEERLRALEAELAKLKRRKKKNG